MFFWSQKLQNEISLFSRISSRMLSRIFPNCLRMFLSSFPWKRRRLKFHHKSPPFVNAKCTGKLIENFTTVFRRANKLISFRFFELSCANFVAVPWSWSIQGFHKFASTQNRRWFATRRQRLRDARLRAKCRFCYRQTIDSKATAWTAEGPSPFLTRSLLISFKPLPFSQMSSDQGQLQ